MTDLDPRLTFDTFVVGPANRLAAAAARRASDSPGTSYNPLFLYANSGLGKSHLLTAVAHHASRAFPGSQVVFTTMEGYLDDLTRTLEAGDQADLRERYREADFLLLDDVQFLTGQPQAQEMVLRTLDALTGAGKQVFLASDRPPAEINGLDERLVSRFSGGLIVDIGAPEFETRVAILRRKAEEQEAALGPGVAEIMARIPFRNVRELQGALNRILVIQELEGRGVDAEEVRALLRVDERVAGPTAPAPSPPEPVQDETPPWWTLLLEVADEAETEGFSAARLRRIAESGREPPRLEAVIEAFNQDLDRLRTLRAEAEAVGEGWAGAGPSPFLDPERVEEAEAWVASARERTRPFPGIAPGPALSDLGNRYPPLALKASERMVAEERPDYLPLFLVSRDPSRARGLLEGMARSLLHRRPRSRVGLISAAAFVEEFIQTLSAGTTGAWRERWGSVDLLLVDGVQDLEQTERAQEEFFHVFEALKRRGARVSLSGDRLPEELGGIEDRLRSRFGGGLVLELEILADAPAPPPPPSRVQRPPSGLASPTDAAVLLDLVDIDIRDDGRGGLFPPEVEAPPAPGFPRLSGPGSGGSDRAAAGGIPGPVLPPLPEVGGGTRGAPAATERWFPSGEKVVWEWMRLEDRLVEDAD